MATDLRTFLFIGVSAVALLLITGCNNKFSDPQTLVAEAKQYQQKGDNNAAIIQLKNALQKDPDIAEARYMLGALYVDAGDPTSGEKELRKALELGFDTTKVIPALARSLLMQERYQQVLDETREDQRSAPLLATRGYAELALGGLSGAANSFDQALKLEPEFPEALLGQARLALAARKMDKASQLVDHVLAMAPKNTDAWLLRGDLYDLQGNNERAAAAYGEAVQIRPDNISAHIRRASVLTSLNNFDAAQAEINAARKVARGDPIVDYGQALLLFRTGKSGPALEAIQRVLRVAPDHLPSVVLAGLLQYSRGSPEQAERNMRRFLDHSPNSIYARKLLAFIQIKSNQNERALQTLQPALKQAPQDAQMLTLAAEAYIQLRQFTKATQYLQLAAGAAPSDTNIHTRLGMTALALGETNRAIAEFESAVQLNRGLSQADTLLIMTHLRKNEYDKALDASLKLQKKQPQSPVTYYLLGGAYLGKKDLINARKSFERAVGLQQDYMPAAMFLARMDLQAKQPDKAQERFKAILAKNGKNVEAMIGLASIDQATGNVNGYVSWLEKARTEDPTVLAPRVLLARHYLRMQDASKALAVAAEARTIQPYHPDVLNVQGEAQSASGDKPGAVTTFATLVKIVPESPLAHYRLATAYMAKEDYVAAADSFRNALKLKSDYLDAKAGLALVEYRAGKYDESLALAQQIQRQDPKLAVGYSLEGDSLMAQQKFGPAASAYEKAFARRQSGIVATKLHGALSQAGKIKEAEDRLLKWLQSHPTDTGSRLYLANAYINAVQNQQAIEQYQLVLRNDAKNLLALNNLATLLRQQNDPRALDFFEQSYKLKPDNVTITENLGWALVERGKLTRGVELLRKAAGQAPDNPEIRYHLAAALAKSGETALARSELERLLAKNTEFRHRDEAAALLKQL